MKWFCLAVLLLLMSCRHEELTNLWTPPSYPSAYNASDYPFDDPDACRSNEVWDEQYNCVPFSHKQKNSTEVVK